MITIPRGLCQCGCGSPTNIPRENDASKGWVRGVPMPYLAGHRGRLVGPDYLEEDRGYKTPCWIWKKRLQRGYAVISGKPPIRVYRVYFEREYGPIPPGTEPDHLCKQKECIRPDHLEAVTHQENTQRGLVHKLSRDSVRAIFLHPDRAWGSRVRIGKVYGVTPEQIGNIRAGKDWRNVTAKLKSLPLIRL